MNWNNCVFQLYNNAKSINLAKCCYIIKAHVSTQENFPQKENLVKYNWQEVENFQILTMIFSENFLSVEMFLNFLSGNGLYRVGWGQLPKQNFNKVGHDPTTLVNEIHCSFL